MNILSKIYYLSIILYISIISIFIINNLNFKNIKSLNDIIYFKDANQNNILDNNKAKYTQTFIVNKNLEEYKIGDAIVYFENNSQKEYKIAIIKNTSGNLLNIETQNKIIINIPSYLIEGKILFSIPFLGWMGNILEQIKDPIFFMILPVLIIFLLELYKLLYLFDFKSKRKMLSPRNFKDKIKLSYRSTLVISSTSILFILLATPERPVLGYVDNLYQKINTLSPGVASIANVTKGIFTSSHNTVIMQNPKLIYEMNTSLTNGEKQWQIINENSNPSKLIIKATNIINKENGCNDQERKLDQDCNDNNTSGDIGKYMIITLLKDDIIIATTTLDKKETDSFGDSFTNSNTIILQPGELEIIKMRWSMDEAYYTNEIQGDEMTFNLEFTLTDI